MKDLVIWDSKQKVPNDLEPLLWVENPLSEDSSDSIFGLIEQDKQALKSEFVEYIYDLGKTEIQGKSIEDRLEIKNGFSYWWMTIIAEKCNFSKSPKIDNLIKIIALRNKIIQENIEMIILYTHDMVLIDSLRALTNDLKIEFTFDLLPLENKRSRNSLKKFIPRYLQSIIWFIIFFIKTRRLYGVGKEKWENSKAELTFVSWSSYIDQKALQNSHYVSNYWTNLPDKVSSKSYHSNWLHIIVPDHNFDYGKRGKEAINLLNENKNLQTHTTIYSFFNFFIFVSTFYDWFLLLFSSYDSIEALKKNSKQYLWPYLENDWLESIYGKTAISNLLTLNLLYESMKSIKKQKLCVYLMENQPWEYALNYSLKTFDHGKVLAFPHTTIKYWDLRYTVGKKIFIHDSNPTYPGPDLICSSGKIMRRSLISNGYPEKKLIDLEALRYLFLKDNELIHCESKIDDKPLEILVLGHYVYQINIDMLDVLEKASVFTESKLNVTFKPHPLTPIDLNLYPNLKIQQENKSIHEIYSRYDYAYCSSQATASLDAFFLGMKVINFTDPVSLNLHPLYNLIEATFIKDHKQLTLALNEQRNHTSSLSLDDFFYLDGKLHKWLSFIEKELNS